MTFLARAGFDTNEILQSIEGTLQLAQAGELDLARAADIASNVLSGFNLDAAQSGRVVDILAKASLSANTNVTQLGEALKFAAPTAVALGLSVEETIATIGQLSDAGIQGGLAGRGFQALVTGFIQRRDQIESLIGEFDLQADGLSDVIRRLNAAGITIAQVGQIFGASQVDIFSILTNATNAVDGQVSSLDALADGLRNAEGTAARVATVMDDNLNGALLGAQSRLQELILTLADAGAEDALITAIEELSGLLTLAAENADIVSVALVALSVRAVLPLAVSLGGAAVTAARGFITSMVSVQATAGTTSAAMFTLRGGLLGVSAALGGPLTIAIAAAAAGYVTLSRRAAETQATIDRGNTAVERTKTLLEETSALLNTDDPIAEIGESARSSIVQLDGINEAISDVVGNLQELRQETSVQLFTQQSQELTALNASIDELERRRTAFARRRFQGNARGDGGNVSLADARREFDLSDSGQELREQIFARDQLQRSIEDLGPLIQDDIREAFSGADPVEVEVALQSNVETGTVKLSAGAEEALVALGRQRLAAEEELAQARRLGIDDATQRLQDQLSLIQRTTELIEAGADPDNAARFAQDEARGIPSEASLAALAKSQRDRLDTAIQLTEEASKGAAQKRETAAEQGNALQSLNAELALQQAVRDGDIQRVDAITQVIRARELENQFIEADVEATEARRRAEAVAAAEAAQTIRERDLALQQILARRQLELDLTVASAVGDENAVTALQDQLDLLQRIENLRAAGLQGPQAEERARREADTLRRAEREGEARQAQQNLADDFAFTISDSLRSAIQSGDYGGILENVIASAAENGLNSAFQGLNTLLGDLFNSAFSGGGLSGLLGGAVGGIGGIGTPGIVDPATERAVSGLGEASTQAGAAITGQLLSSSVTAATGAVTQGAASTSAASALAVLTAAATTAATSLTALAATNAVSGGASGGSGFLNQISSLFGGARARGGPTSPGKFYVVGEQGPELFVPDVAGRVRSNRESFGRAITRAPAQSAGPRAVIEVGINGARGNSEIQAMVRQGMSEAIRIAGAQAGPRASEFRERRG